MKSLSLPFFIIVLLSLSCEYEGPEAIWDPKLPNYAAPVITRVEPENSIAALEIKIIGDNFSPIVENNIVYVGGQKAEIKSASKTEIRIYRPNIVGDSLQIKVVVKGAYTIAKYSPYKLENMTTTVDAFGQTDDIVAITIDGNDNLYGASNRIIYKVTPTGEESQYGTYSGKISYIRTGPAGYLYVQKPNSNVLSRIAPGGGALETFLTLPKRVSFFDFDRYGNIFLGGKNSGLVLVTSNASMTALGIYDDYDIKAVRIFEDYVYVPAEYTGGDPLTPKVAIWRNKILNENGDLGEKELVYDWANSGEFSTSNILDITFSQDKDMYISTNYKDPVLIVHPDGTSEPLYKNILLSPVSNLIWDNGHYLYLKRSASYQAIQVVRVEMNKPGAPYYGRML